MKSTINDKIIAYLALISGLSISAVAIYYSVVGLTAIYPASVGPIVVMGVVLELGKLSATLWLKQNWDYAPRFLKFYILPAVIALMLITSLGVFGFLSKAHSDQSLVSGDVQSKLAIYDEKIKTAKENIDADRKQLKQMDEAVDQIMGRSTDEKGADKANAVRKSQQRDRASLAKDIETQQRLIASLNDEAAPIRAENRKVEAEVGPIKYIAAFIYGANPDSSLLEKAVIWVTVLIVIVLDPMAVILLLASQYSFQRFRDEDDYPTIAELDTFVGEKPTPEEIHIEEDADLEPAPDPSDYGINREDAQPDPVVKQRVPEYKILDDDHEPDHIDAWNSMLAKAEKEITKEVVPDVMDERPGDYVSKPDTYVQNEEQSTGTTLWKEISGVTQSEYQAVAKEHQIYNFAEQVIAGELSIDDIIPSLRADVLAQVEKNKQDNLDQQFSIIEGLARQVMSGMLKIEQIPDDLRESVRARLNG